MRQYLSVIMDFVQVMIKLFALDQFEVELSTFNSKVSITMFNKSSSYLNFAVAC